MNGVRTHTVETSDTLGKIARAHGLSVEQLANLNGIEDVNLIQVGQKIQLRADFSRVSGSVETTATRTRKANPVIQFVVVDKLLEPIKALPYRLTFKRSDRIATGITSEYGLTELEGGEIGESVEFRVKRVEGSYKKIYETKLADTRKVVTAYSPSISIEFGTQQHEGAPGRGEATGREEDGYPILVIDKDDVELDFLEKYDGTSITDEDYIVAASSLGCEVAAIKAIAITETGSVGSFFEFSGSDAVPAILFERHYFHRLTGGAYDKTHPDISDEFGGGYGKFSMQYKKLLRAYRLNEDAALKSASWGKFQIMGRWHEAAGFSTVGEFVKSISASESSHLRAFVNFIKADSRLSTSIVDKNWLKFARAYNGPRQNGYDVKMQENYNALVE